jgi:hypothetical protein
MRLIGLCGVNRSGGGRGDEKHSKASHEKREILVLEKTHKTYNLIVHRQSTKRKMNENEKTTKFNAS